MTSSLFGPFWPLSSSFLYFSSFSSSAAPSRRIIFGFDWNLERGMKQCCSSQNSFFRPRPSPHLLGSQQGGRPVNQQKTAIFRHPLKTMSTSEPPGEGQNRQQRKSKTPSSILTVALWVWRCGERRRRGGRPSNHLSLPPPSSRHPPPSPSFSHLLLMVFTLQIYHPPSPYNNLDGPRSLYVCMYYGNPRS